LFVCLQGDVAHLAKENLSFLLFVCLIVAHVAQEDLSLPLFVCLLLSEHCSLCDARRFVFSFVCF